MRPAPDQAATIERVLWSAAPHCRLKSSCLLAPSGPSFWSVASIGLLRFAESLPKSVGSTEALVHFSAMVTDQLGAYVYALADPRIASGLRDRVFYIGKGNGNRCFSHAGLELKLGEQPLQEAEHKLGRIREIREAGLEVEVLIVAHALSDKSALKLEAVLIPLLGGTNEVAGHGGWQLWLTRSQINEAYDRPVSRDDVPVFQGNMLVVSLNRQDLSSLLQPGAEQRLAEATLGNWSLAEGKSACVDCVVGVKNGFIVSIFKTEKSNGRTVFQRINATKKGGHGRSKFSGVRMAALEANLRGRSLHDGPDVLSSIRMGAGCEFYKSKH